MIIELIKDLQKEFIYIHIRPRLILYSTVYLRKNTNEINLFDDVCQFEKILLSKGFKLVNKKEESKYDTDAYWLITLTYEKCVSPDEISGKDHKFINEYFNADDKIPLYFKYAIL